MKIRFIPDKPVEEVSQDCLELDYTAFLIQNAIQETETPFVYGVLGDWGSGKTSLLRLVEKKFKEDFEKTHAPCVPIWFNAWQYENEENIIYPLLYAIKQSYEINCNSFSSRESLKDTFLRAVKCSALAVTDLGLRAITKHFTGEVLKLSDLDGYSEELNELEYSLNDWADQVNNFSEAFQNLLDRYAIELAHQHDERLTYNQSSEKSDPQEIRFVILIDDVDRCLPDTAISLIEKIKNFLSVNKAVFVIALNPKIIGQGIRHKFSGIEIAGREYLEKILNFSFYVPEPFPGVFTQFVRHWFQKLFVNKELSNQFQPLFNIFGDILEKCSFTNPRKIKRILNRYLLLISNFENLEDYQAQCNNDHIVRLIILAEYYHSLFLLIIKYHIENLDLESLLNDLTLQNISMHQFERKYGISISKTYQSMSRELINFEPASFADDLMLAYQIARVV